MTFPLGAQEIISAADTWYQGARLFPRIGLRKIEERHPILTHWTIEEDAVQRWHDAVTTAYVLCAMRSSAALLESKESGLARRALLDLYKNDFSDGFLLVDATIATEEWMAVLERSLTYGTWIFYTVAQTNITDEQEDETVELASTLGAMIVNFADEWWTK
jgi:hypothetical protein